MVPEISTAVLSIMSDGRGGYIPVPTLLTEAEALLYLRLDTLGRKDPAKTLQYYREKHLLKATRIGNVNFYTRDSLDAFITEMTMITAEKKGAKL